MNKEQIIDKIGEKNWDAFCEFMFGQTVSAGEDGKIDYYECDVENFVNKLKGKPTFFD